jgi:preprotein translocase subunit SecF
MGRIDVERAPYEEYTDRQLAVIPLVILGISLAIIASAYVLTGTPVSLGFEFTGGTEIEFVADDTSTNQIEQVLSEHQIESVRSVGVDGNSYIVQTQATGEDAEAIESTINDEYGDGEDVVERVEQRSASFGGDTQSQALLGMIIAFTGMSLLVALMFRTFVPSLAVVLSAFSDIVVPVALMNVFNIELTLGAVAALLMIIGYSVDSDILLNNHVLRRRGGFYKNAYSAMRTGISMTLTSIAAMVTMAIVARVFGIPLLGEVALILVFGLCADLMNTYLLNMSLLRWYTDGGSA